MKIAIVTDAWSPQGNGGTKVVVGDGPDRAELQRRFRSAQFVGYKFGEELARHLSSAVVFPSRTDGGEDLVPTVAP